MFCPECGQQNVGDRSFCQHCGARLSITQKVFLKRSKKTVLISTIVLILITSSALYWFFSRGTARSGFAAGTKTVSTRATQFESMPDAGIDIEVLEEGCATVTFSGYFMAGTGGAMGNGSLHLQVVIDGEPMEGHRDRFNDVGLALDAGKHYLVSYSFWKCNVKAGKHHVEVRWSTHEGAPPLISLSRSLIFHVMQ